MNYSIKFIKYLTSSAFFSLGVVGLFDIVVNDYMWYEFIIINLISLLSFTAALFYYNHIDEINE